MLTLNDGRTELWQWDTGRKLTVDAECSQVHFSNKVFGRSIDVDVVDGMAIIPDILLQTDKDLTAWAFVGTPENGYTKISKVFKVNKRNKPADYVFTPTDQTTLGEILDRIEDLENRPSGDVSEEDIQNAVNDYLDRNPVSFDEEDPTVPAWAKQPDKPNYTAEEVGALPNTTVIPAVPTALPNPHKLTINGAAQAEYDGSEAVTLTIPESSSGGDEMRHIITFSLEEDVSMTYIDKDSDGNPFALKELLVNIKSVGAESNTTGANFKLAINNTAVQASKILSDVAWAVRQANSFCSHTIKTVSDGLVFYSFNFKADDTNVYDENMKLVACRAMGLSNIAPYETITSLVFGSSGAPKLGKGTIIAVWGR